MNLNTKSRKAVGALGIVAIASILMVSLVAYNLSTAVAAPANKTTISASNVVAVPATAFTTLLDGTIKVSTPSDLRVSFNHECSIHTGLNLDDETETATSAIREDIRLNVTKADGSVYTAEAALGSGDDGIVTMCGRAYHMDTNILSVLNATCTVAGTCDGSEIYLDSFIRTKQAHSWDWIVLDVGPGVVTLTLEAKIINALDELTTGSSKTKGKASDSGVCPTHDDNCVDTVLEVGKRSLIIVEDKLATGT